MQLPFHSTRAAKSSREARGKDEEFLRAGVALLQVLVCPRCLCTAKILCHAHVYMH